ncbi:hypothetical protein Droror1_Dr00001217 [Drosera rotundifolia]
MSIQLSSLLLVLVIVELLLTLSLAQNSPKDYVDAHDYTRSQVDVGPISWSKRLVDYAQNYANIRAQDCALQHSDGPYGENLAIGGGNGYDFTGLEAVQLWVDEKQYYHYDDNSCTYGQMCGHYTQVVWHNTTQVGCARAQCYTGQWFIICSYYPPGNCIGEHPVVIVVLDAGFGAGFDVEFGDILQNADEEQIPRSNSLPDSVTVVASDTIYLDIPASGADGYAIISYFISPREQIQTMSDTTMDLTVILSLWLQTLNFAVKPYADIPTAMILNFSDPDSIPIEEELNEVFRQYGSLLESETEVLTKSSCAKVVLRTKSDAEAAFSNSGKFKTLGPSLSSYRLNYDPILGKD